MSYHIEIELFGLPKRTNNTQSSWRARMAESRKWKSLVASAVILSGNRPVRPLKKAKLICTRFSSIEPDYDGLVSGFKHPIDGLVEAGVLVNDKMSVIGKPDYRWEQAKQKQGKIKIEVYGVSA